MLTDAVIESDSVDLTTINSTTIILCITTATIIISDLLLPAVLEVFPTP